MNNVKSKSTGNVNKKPFRLSLRGMVALGVALPIFLLLVFISLFNYSREYQLMDEQARIDAIQLGDITINSLNHSMLTKDYDHLYKSINDLSKLENIERIRIIGISGDVFADSNQQDSMKIWSLDSLECQKCHQYSANERPRVISLETPSKGWRISAPVDNIPQCHECHDPELNHLGVLLMDTSLTGRQSKISNDLRMNLLISVLSTVFVSILIYFLIHILVVRRVELIRKPLAEYAQGEFSTRIQSTSSINDELNEFADTFNNMADKLEKHTKEEVEKQELRERAVAEERERIARELHDGFAQVLGYVNTKVMAARLLVKRKKLKEADEQLENLEQASRGLFVDVREAILGLKMSGLSQKGLDKVLKTYINEYWRLSGIPSEFTSSINLDKTKIQPEVSFQIFRIVQEALNNIRKHSNASKVSVDVSQNNGTIQFKINDNGIGFDTIDAEEGQASRLGLSNMKKRADEIGADFKIVSNIGEGTQVIISLTLDKLEAVS